MKWATAHNSANPAPKNEPVPDASSNVSLSLFQQFCIKATVPLLCQWLQYYYANGVIILVECDFCTA